MEHRQKFPTEIENVEHNHYTNWYMKVNVKYFVYGAISGANNSDINIIREIAGEHEMGHVLGLKDVDLYCTARTDLHHEELVMGYGNLYERTRNATYKDIAGVAIVRGFHDDSDHIWMKRVNSDATIDLICAQCNGVLYDVSLDGNGTTYKGQLLNEYKKCIHYNGENSNMLLVATDGVRDYFKCQNCRHIDTIEIDKEYTLNNYSSTINQSLFFCFK